VRVAAIQHDIVWEDRAATLARVGPMVESAAASGARLVLLTEMFSVGFSMAADRISEDADGPSTAFLLKHAEASGAWVGASVPARLPSASRPSNVFTLAAPNGDVHRYAKVHPFSYAGEHEHYEAGTEVMTVEIDGVRVTPFVCYDLRFADGFWDAGPTTDVFVVVANWPSVRRHHWTTLLRARAIENQAFVVGVNRVGDGDGLEHAGDSQIIDPMGEVLVSAAGVETILVADLDPALVTETRARFPFINDRTRGGSRHTER
jgi:predicted amidohydrolase